MSDAGRTTVSDAERQWAASRLGTKLHPHLQRLALPVGDPALPAQPQALVVPLDFVEPPCVYEDQVPILQLESTAQGQGRSDIGLGIGAEALALPQRERLQLRQQRGTGHAKDAAVTPVLPTGIDAEGTSPPRARLFARRRRGANVDVCRELAGTVAEQRGGVRVDQPMRAAHAANGARRHRKRADPTTLAALWVVGLELAPQPLERVAADGEEFVEPAARGREVLAE
mmetsp:Transcript_10983/g.18700  ORF Transcript_10983/g.18700 Transcript_10983/m.18700 type:complete len:228 (+) Transcript_10983:192-875(+)